MRVLQKDAKTVAVVGASPSGISAALDLSRGGERDGIRVVLIEERGEYLLEHLLNDLLTGRRASLEVALPLKIVLEGTGVELVRERLHGIDFGARKIATSGGSLAYDYLVLAPNPVADFGGVADADRYAFPLIAAADAEKLRERVIALFDAAAREGDARKRKAMLTVAICGKGIAGAELAIAVAEWLEELRLAHWVPRDEIEVVYVEQGDGRSWKLAGEIGVLFESAFRERGIRHLIGDRAVRVGPKRLHLESGVAIDTLTVIWKAGTRPHPFIAETGLKLDERGRVEVDSFMRTDRSGVYAAGDSAAPLDADGRPAIAARSLSYRGQGLLVAKDVRSCVRGRSSAARRELRLGRVIKLGEGHPLFLTRKGRIVLPPISKLAEAVRNFAALYALGGAKFLIRHRDWLELGRSLRADERKVA